MSSSLTKMISRMSATMVMIGIENEHTIPPGARLHIARVEILVQGKRQHRQDEIAQTKCRCILVTCPHKHV